MPKTALMIAPICVEDEERVVLVLVLVLGLEVEVELGLGLRLELELIEGVETTVEASGVPKMSTRASVALLTSKAGEEGVNCS